MMRDYPEAKLELMDGKLIVGNSLVGSRLLLKEILSGWGVRAAVDLATPQLWLEALNAAYGLELTPSTASDPELLAAASQRAGEIDWTAEDLSAGVAADTHDHWAVRNGLIYALWQVSPESGGDCLSRDFVMRLGENGMTPDAIYFTGPPRNRLYEYFLSGPADIVFEVIMPGHEEYDVTVKRALYAAGGVPEYVIVDPKRQEVEFWRNVNGDFRRQFPDAEGRYRFASAPNLIMLPDTLWEAADKWTYPQSAVKVFEVERPDVARSRQKSVKDMPGWGDLPFAPGVSLVPTKIEFRQYISWCPEAKFEYWDDRIQIGSAEGVRNIVGMLLMTFGLADAIRLLPPRQWLDAIAESVAYQAGDEDRRETWWALARQAADLLRSKYGAERVGVIGDLVRPTPLTYWSEITLVVWGMRDGWTLELYQDLTGLSREPKINLYQPDGHYMPRWVKESLETELYDL